jgi:hypothetical protein
LYFHFFKGLLSKILICGGNYPGINSCEVINIESSATAFKNPPNFPATVYVGIKGLGFKDNPIIGGGHQNGTQSNSCYSLENNDNESISSFSMNSVRAAHLPVEISKKVCQAISIRAVEHLPF